MRTTILFLLALSFAVCEPGEAAHAPGVTALLRVDYTEWGSDCLCMKDCRQVDSLFVRVRAGDTFLPDRFCSEWFELERGGPFRVLGVEPGGAVRLHVAPALRPPPCARKGEIDTVVTRKPLELSTCSYDGGLAVSVRVVDSLPPGATLGVIHERKPHPAPRWPTMAMRGSPPRIPPTYRGPVREVGVRLQLSPDARLLDAVVIKPVSAVLDSLALQAVRTWKFKIGSDCEGEWNPLEMQVEVAFQPRGPREARDGLNN